MRTFALAAALLAGTQALAHDGVHDAWLETLKQPGGASCCSGRDCLPTDDWRPTAAGYEVLLQGRWTLVPADRVITHRGNPTGRAVLRSMGDTIFCFVPGAGA